MQRGVGIQPTTSKVSGSTDNPANICRLDMLNGSNITRRFITDKNKCLTELCDIYGPLNINAGYESKCVFDSKEIKEYRKVSGSITTPSITIYPQNNIPNFISKKRFKF